MSGELHAVTALTVGWDLDAVEGGGESVALTENGTHTPWSSRSLYQLSYSRHVPADYDLENLL